MSGKHFSRGSMNVFEDIGLADAEEMQTKMQLAHVINKIVDGQGLTQAKAATLLGVAPRKLSALAHYKLDGCSAERLMTYLTVSAVSTLETSRLS